MTRLTDALKHFKRVDPQFYVESLYSLPKNTSRSSLLAIAEKWSPYRTYASLLLWRTRDKK